MRNHPGGDSVALCLLGPPLSPPPPPPPTRPPASWDFGPLPAKCYLLLAGDDPALSKCNERTQRFFFLARRSQLAHDGKQALNTVLIFVTVARTIQPLT